MGRVLILLRGAGAFAFGFLVTGTIYIVWMRMGRWGLLQLGQIVSGGLAIWWFLWLAGKAKRSSGWKMVVSGSVGWVAFFWLGLAASQVFGPLPNQRTPNPVNEMREGVLHRVNEIRKGAQQILERDAAGEAVSTQERLGLTDKSVATLGELAAQASGTDARALELLAALAKGIRDTQQSYLESLDVFVEAGGIAPVGLTSPDKIDERLKMLERVLGDLEGYENEVAALPVRYRREMISAGVPQMTASRFSERAARGLGLDRLPELRRLRYEQMATRRSVLTLYKVHWGGWEYNEATGVTLFDSAEVLEECDRLEREIDILAERILQIEREKLDQQAQRAR